MRPKQHFFIFLAVTLVMGHIVFAEYIDPVAEPEHYEQEQHRREKFLLSGPCSTEYRSHCVSEPVISGRRAVYKCLIQHEMSAGCEAFLRREAPDLLEPRTPEPEPDPF